MSSARARGRPGRGEKVEAAIFITRTTNLFRLHRRGALREPPLERPEHLVDPRHSAQDGRRLLT